MRGAIGVALLVAGCGGGSGGSDGGSDLAAASPDLARAAADLGAGTPDVAAPAPDVAMSAEDLAMSPADIALPLPDVAAPAADLVAAADLAVAADLVAPADVAQPPPDLTAPRDLATPPDLTIPPDLAIPPDLVQLPDLTVSCANGLKDGNETDVDCGGATCRACGDGKACGAASDCASGLCAGGACAGTVLLLHFDGNDGDKKFPDASPSKHVLTPGGDVKLSTADSKFGGACAFFDGSGDLLTVDDGADWNLGTGDFTVEYWMRSANNVQNARMHTFSWGTPGSNLDFDYNDKDQGGWGFWVYWNSGGTPRVIVNTVYTDNQWHHQALVRSGTTFTVYVDGKSIGSTTYAGALNLSGANVPRRIGIYNDAASFPYKGYLDELRILKGVARYTKDFIPPSAPF